MRPKRPGNLFRCRGRDRNLGEGRYAPKVADLARQNPPESVCNRHQPIDASRFFRYDGGVGERARW